MNDKDERQIILICLGRNFLQHFPERLYRPRLKRIRGLPSGKSLFSHCVDKMLILRVTGKFHIVLILKFSEITLRKPDFLHSRNILIQLLRKQNLRRLEAPLHGTCDDRRRIFRKLPKFRRTFLQIGHRLLRKPLVGPAHIPFFQISGCRSVPDY